MSGRAYYLKARDTLLSHDDGRGLTRLFNDWDKGDSPSEIKALVASGDCFITLATSLEEICQTLTADKLVASPQLEKLTTILLYLQRHYRISRKPADYRQ